MNQMLLQITQLETAIRSLGTVSSLSGGNTASINSGYKFLNPLAYGDSGSDVSELQKRLIAEGFLTGEATGYFGPATEQAVKKYQTAHSLNPLGTVGPGTRAELNK
jgi:peptidoglycan hydrolase-like protein with peptidoglycan-binding domain